MSTFWYLLAASWPAAGRWSGRRNRPAAYGPDERPPSFDAQLSQPVLTGMDVGPVAERVLEAVTDNDLYVFTHPEMKAAVEARFQSILAAFDKSSASRALQNLGARDVPDVGTMMVSSE